jgi:long-chain acyl-CoA synthetase
MNNIINDVSPAERMRFDKLMDSITKNGKLMTLGHLLEWSAKKYGDRIALICRDEQISFNHLFARACMFSELLREKGIKSGDSVLVWLENSIEFYIAYFGALQIGAIVAPLNVYLTERELAHIIKDAHAQIIVTSKSFLERLGDQKVSVPVLLKEDAIKLDELITIDRCSITDKDPDALTLLLYTSGTTGLPKGVMLSSRNALTNAMQAIARQEFKRCKVLCVLPLFHSFAQNACIWTPLLYGCAVIVVPKVDRRLILEGLAKKPSVFLGVPALYGLLCLMKTAPLAGIELFVCGGDALPDKIRSAFALIYNRKICNGYGLTETSPLISIDLDDMTEPTNCVGTPCTNVQVQIRDEQGNTLTQGKIGQLWVTGPNLMLGYHNAQEATDKVLKNGWFDTGDRAYINQRGKIVIAGREKDLIIHKGFNIYPQEIENVLLSHPDVIRAAVIGKKDEAVGEVPIAVVQVRAENSALISELKKRCKEQLAAYKIPKDIIVVKRDPPLTATGKINKKELKQQLFTNEEN